MTAGHEKNQISNFICFSVVQIREITQGMAKTTDPVMVAIIDSGINEDHPDLMGHILEEESHCFVQGDKLHSIFFRNSPVTWI